jgi:glutamate--cysteine ligase
MPVRVQVARTGLKTPFRNGTVRDIAAVVLAISRQGLEDRGYDETNFLKQLDRIVESGENKAENLLRLYEDEWGQSVEPIYKTMAF